MRYWLVALASGLSMLLSGCETIPQPPVIRSQVTAFHQWPRDLQDKTYAFERTQTQDNDLEYRTYEDLVRGELDHLGFTEASPSRPAKLIATLGYDISVRDVQVSEPVLVNPYPYWPGYPGYYGHYCCYGPFYDPFWYGPPVVARRNANYQLFTRRLRVTLSQASDRKMLYDTTVISEGMSGSLAAAMPYMIYSAFMDFPGPNGVPRRVDLPVQSTQAAP